MGEITAEMENLRRMLSANIKKYRAVEGISQEKLAERTGLSDQLIKDIEGCRSWVSDKSIIKLAYALKVEAYQLLYPITEANRLYPIRLPSGILKKLQNEIKENIDSKFAAVITAEE
ncbi:MAG: helix-turn-helix domain-containing protein [Spirochaetaceae bacterium]|jgi:transcriptional regulator with XRE-family HTH domain|nr:helix-turn-helix domain-containing protein [Spirochaetaceae bacterium]